MPTWLSRWFSARAPAQVARAASPKPTTAPESTVFGVRRPLVDRAGQLAGYQFGMPSTLAERMQSRGEPAAAAAYAVSLLAAMQPTLRERRCALAALPLTVLVRPSVLRQVPVGAMLALTDAPWDGPDAMVSLAALRQRGARIGGCGTPMPSGGQFVLLEASGVEGAALAAAIAVARQAAPGAQVVATGVDGVDELEAALASGADLAGGRIDGRNSTCKAAPLPLRQQQVCALLGKVMRDIELPLLADELRADVGFSYQLLRHANSAWLGLSRPTASTDEAVMLLGRDGLFRWLSLLLLAGANARPTSNALQEVAMARARLLETLAVRRGEPPTQLFTIGLLSLLDVMLQTTMADALAPLHLPHEVVQALVDRTGPWHDALALALALENNDVEAAERLAVPFGGLVVAVEASDAAWRWARDARGNAAG